MNLPRPCCARLTNPFLMRAGCRISVAMASTEMPSISMGCDSIRNSRVTAVPTGRLSTLEETVEA